MMQKLFRFQLKKSLDKGFTTLEVLVSIVIALAFVSVAMQSFVLAMAMKVQAQEKQRANLLIQEELELLNDRASILAEDHANKCNPIASGGNTEYENGYAEALFASLGNEPDAVYLLSSGTGKRIVLARDHISDTSSDAPHRTLKINYRVRKIDEGTGNPTGDPIANRYVEVIPDVALRCP